MRACGAGPAGRRNRALIAVLWRCGLRCAEALALYPKDLDVGRGEVQVLHGKGDRRRVVAIDPGAAAMCEAWAAERRALELTGRHPFFCVISQPTRGMALGSPYVRELFKRLAERAGIDKRVHAHGLRHTYAAFLIEQPNVNLLDVKTMLGHSSLAVTERYVDHLNPSERLAKVRSVSWPGEDSVSARSSA
jgi:site-specific recombinase XerD